MSGSFAFGFSGEDIDLEDDETETSSPGSEMHEDCAPDIGFSQPVLHSLEDMVGLHKCPRFLFLQLAMDSLSRLSGIYRISRTYSLGFGFRMPRVRVRPNFSYRTGFSTYSHDHFPLYSVLAVPVPV